MTDREGHGNQRAASRHRDRDLDAIAVMAMPCARRVVEGVDGIEPGRANTKFAGLTGGVPRHVHHASPGGDVAVPCHHRAAPHDARSRPAERQSRNPGEQLKPCAWFRSQASQHDVIHAHTAGVHRHNVRTRACRQPHARPRRDQSQHHQRPGLMPPPLPQPRRRATTCRDHATERDRQYLLRSVACDDIACSSITHCEESPRRPRNR